MLQHSFENVRERLLRAGIPPRHVRRYVVELREHMTDLVARERATGLDAHEAEARARTILGTDTQLVQAMIERGAPRSLAAKAPWAVFGILPVTLLVVVIILLHSWSMAFFFPYRALSGAAVPENVRAIGMALTVLGSYVIGPALAAACIAIALRQRLSSRWVWAGLALIALASGPLGVHIQFLLPEGGMPGGIRGSAAPAVYAQGQVDVAATFAMMVARAVVLFALSALAYRMLKRRAEAVIA